jgi:hypothetical protein
LWNDKGGLGNSADAKNITMKVISLNIIDELVGYSDGTADQSFTVAYSPIESISGNTPVYVKVNGTIWTMVPSFTGHSSIEEVYILDFATGTVTFGNGTTGKIPSLGATIEVSYTPDRTDFGSEIQEFAWVGVQSAGVISNPRSMLLERQISSDITHVTVSHTPILSVSGVYLNTDPNKFGTNYYTGGSFNANAGTITLGTALPDPETTVLIDYTYTIADDGEASYTQIGGDITHTFLNAIPSNNAKLINLRLLSPETTSPSGLINLRFKILITFNA